MGEQLWAKSRNTIVSTATRWKMIWSTTPGSMVVTMVPLQGMICTKWFCSNRCSTLRMGVREMPNRLHSWFSLRLFPGRIFNEQISSSRI